MRKSSSKLYGPSDPSTPIETILEHMFKVIIQQGGGLDVFMYVQAHPDHNSSSWTGLVNQYLPSVGDTRACEPLLNHSYFGASTGNRLFCLVEPELQLLTPVLCANPMWGSYDYGETIHAREQLLQQLYGMYRANLAAKQVALAEGFSYEYKLRVRPDVALVRPMPRFNELNFSATQPGGCRKILHMNKAVNANGAEDMFNVGHADDMDCVLDRYIDLVSRPLPFAGPPKAGMPRQSWNAEKFLQRLLETRYHLCLKADNRIEMSPVRSRSKFHPYTPKAQTWAPAKIANQWRQLPVDPPRNCSKWPS